ncbi:hypothetical protein N7523_005499 [Penicillium sp. IBT 18751x]|nr:hypothetical protein N7523_005499 [Penicillium sp. IBT 18751x]
MSGKSTGISVAEMPPATIKDLQELKVEHEFDLNLPSEIEKDLDEALATGDAEIKGHVVGDLMEDSPYPEVRAAVLNYDEGGTGNTIRAWTLGLIFATIGSGLNALFSLHSPTISITSYIAEVVAFPFGVAWARFLPNLTFTVFGNKLELNPGPFTKKEHALITIMANATFAGGFAYTLDIITAQRGFYGQRYGWPFEIFTTISTQTLGFGLGGVLHRFLVEPAAMIWPSNLVNTTLFTAMHERGLNPPDPAKTAGWTVNRYRLFMYIMIGAFCWYWFPGLIAPFLSVFAFVTWIKPNNVIINQLFGGATGISLIPISFDWSIISGYVTSPMISPWFAIANTLIGMVAWFWILTPALHYTNVFYGKFLPMSDSNSYDNTGGVYNVTRILTSEYTFDLAKYESYSPLFLSTTFALCYGLSFAGLAAVIVHVSLFHGKEIWHRMRAAGQKHEDIHSRLMAKYDSVPVWWYVIVLVIMTAIGLAVVLSYPTNMSWWAFFVSLIIALVWTLPIGMIQATTNIQLGLNVITEFIVGYIQPGKPMAMMLFKTYGYISMSQALYFCQDMKLGHYMKIPPRVTFWAQMASCVWSSVVQVAVLNWAFGSITDICSPTQSNKYTCPNGRVFFNASVIWGVIGPKRMFSVGQMYATLQWFWLAGIALPVLIWLAARKWPQSRAKFLNAPVIFSGTGMIPPATPLTYLVWGTVGFVFNKYIRNRWRGWWMEYNYVVSAGLDVGTALCLIVMLFAISLSKSSFPSWWGNDQALATMDYTDTAIQVVLPEGQTFGPKVW